MKGLGRRWLCPVCGKVLDRPPTRIDDVPRRVSSRVVMSLPGYYHSWKCSRPMVRVTVTLEES